MPTSDHVVTDLLDNIIRYTARMRYNADGLSTSGVQGFGYRDSLSAFSNRVSLSPDNSARTGTAQVFQPYQFETQAYPRPVF